MLCIHTFLYIHILKTISLQLEYFARHRPKSFSYRAQLQGGGERVHDYFSCFLISHTHTQWNFHNAAVAAYWGLLLTATPASSKNEKKK